MIKQRLPWPLKILTKLALGAAGVDYRVLKRLGLVEHGRMEDPRYATEIFDLHVAAPCREWHRTPGGTLLEIGPGDSVATGILARAAGFSAAELIDAGCFADLRPAAVTRLFAALGATAPVLPPGANGREVRTALAAHGINYRTEGVRSLAQLAPGSIAYSFSNTVLQHVHRDELPRLVAELGRAHAPGSCASHSVNFTDHFSGGFVHEQLPEWFIESRLVKRAHLYTNRVGAARLLELFEGAGFAVRRLTAEFFDASAPARGAYENAGDFRRAIGSRRILRVTYQLRKDGSPR